PENMLDQCVMCASEDSFVGCLSSDCTHKTVHSLRYQVVQVRLGPGVLNCTGKLGTGLLHHAHPRASLPDFLRVDAGRNRALCAEHRDHVRLVLRSEE